MDKEIAMLKTSIIAAVLIGLISALAGCNGAYMYQEETALDRNWGRSYETAKYNQMLNTDAGQNLDPVEGLDGVPAGYSVEKYQDTFKEDQSQETINILKLQ
jgi:hypothetical protein